MDKDTFKELYFNHHPRVLRVAYYILKDQLAAEDIAQEVFLKLWDRGQLDEIDSIEGYLVQMARNSAISYLESSKRETIHLIMLQDHQVGIHEDESATDRNEKFRKSLEKAVSELSPQCRLVFSLSRFEGLTNEEIAEYLGISKRTVETQISAAFKRFRTDLKPLFLNGLFVLALLCLMG